MLSLPAIPRTESSLETTVNSTLLLKVSHRLRSHDFPGKERITAYLEGEVINITAIGDQYCIKLICDFDNLWADTHSRVGHEITVFYPDLFDQLWGYPRLQILL